MLDSYVFENRVQTSRHLRCEAKFQQTDACNETTRPAGTAQTLPGVVEGEETPSICQAACDKTA